MNKEEMFLNKVEEKFQHKYTFPNLSYKDCKSKIQILCSNCNTIFEKTPDTFLKSNGCNFCYNKTKMKNKRKTNSKFIEEANIIHNNIYNYNECNYFNKDTKVAIICNKHNLFFQTPRNHLKGQGCPTCAQEVRINNLSLNSKDFLNKVDNKFEKRFKYNLNNYQNLSSKIEVTCPLHGSFPIVAKLHLQSKYGCNSCAKIYKTSTVKTKKIFIEESNIIYKNKYDYSLFDYVDSKTKGIIVCPKHRTISTNTSYTFKREVWL